MRKQEEVNDNTNWISYRKKHRLEKGTKIFICPEYFHFKKALLKRGWHENKDRNSEVFDLKFLIKRSELYKEGTLYDFQTVNHYPECGVLTTKVGLCKSL